MDLIIRARHLDLSEPLKAYADRRLRFSVGAFASRISDVEICVEDVNGPRGGIDKQCAITAFASPIGAVFARARHSDVYSAIDRAAARIRTVLVRRFSRRTDPRRRDATRRG